MATEKINGVYHVGYKGGGGGSGSDPEAVKYTPQTLTDAQKAQARTNIGGASSSELSQVNVAIGNLSNIVGDMQPKVEALTYPAYVVAWDGSSSPVVANIPAGVAVTYDGNSYTGTLAASSSTLEKVYLVSTGTTDNYYRYVTQLNGSTYSWQNIGSTEIDLTDYATKEEVTQLSQEVTTLSSKVAEGKISGDFISALQSILQKAVYTDPDMEDDIAALSEWAYTDDWEVSNGVLIFKNVANATASVSNNLLTIE